MTPKRIAALQWVHDRGQVPEVLFGTTGNPSRAMKVMMEDSDQIVKVVGSHWGSDYALTDKGRRDLHEATQ